MRRVDKNDIVKRSLDVAASVAGLLLASPVIIGTGAFVRWKLGRPALFRRERPGPNGEVFEPIKFRTMLDVDEESGVVTNEQWMTPLGIGSVSGA